MSPCRLVCKKMFCSSFISVYCEFWVNAGQRWQGRVTVSLWFIFYLYHTWFELDLREACKEWEGRRRELNGILECALWDSGWVTQPVLCQRFSNSSYLRNWSYLKTTDWHDWKKQQVPSRDSARKSHGFASSFCKFWFYHSWGYDWFSYGKQYVRVLNYPG